MTLKHLKIFVCVAKHENITRASEELYMTQPAVSLAIKELEEKYNIKLFKREKQRIRITDDGKTLLQYANSTLNSYNDFEEVAIKGSKNKNVKIGLSISVGEKIVPNLFNDYENKNYIMFNVSTSDDIIDKVLSLDVDFGIVETPNIDPRLNVISLISDEIILVASKTYNVPDEIKIDDLIRYPMLLRNKNTGVRNAFENTLGLYNIKINPYIESISNTSLIEFAKNGYGIAAIPAIIYNDSLDLKIIKLKDISITRPISLIYKSNNTLSDEEEKLIEYIIKNISATNSCLN